MVGIRWILHALCRDRAGISAVEYATLLAFVGAGILLATVDLSSAVSGAMDHAAGCLDGTVAPLSC